MELTTVEKALKIVLENSKNLPTETVSLTNSVGRVLKENIVADRDFPPFNRVSMDGIAIDIQTFINGQRTFKIEGIQPAGSPQITLLNTENCVEVMTGAMLPKNTNAVIPYEKVEIKNGIAKIVIKELKHFQNIHKKGLDRKENDVLISENTIISSAEIGVMATVGKSEVKVAKNPKVLIISTGNELVDVNEMPKEHQIRRSNVYTLLTQLQILGITAETTHINDDKSVLKQKIETFLEIYDVLLFSGAVSKGKFDFIPEVLADLGVKKLFHKVQQRPGKPFWFGKKIVDNKKSTVIFAFPGNPVSTFVSCLKYFIPWYTKSLGLKSTPKSAILSEDFTFKPQLTYFLQVKLVEKEGKLIATPIAGKGSGDLANLVDCDGFLELPYNKTNFTKGEVYPLITFRK
ncbi:MAG TPA: molybdopterin molybdotransferase MoeA [Flavobacteriaceae bacterium]|nr:molybdopterin molybdotransferase MoeA [Flavobacteriaceae bacterium]